MKYLLFLLLFSNSVTADSPILPNNKLTPGDIIKEATRESICVPGYSESVRYVPEYLRKQVFDLYKVNPKLDRYEVDHLISLELGGSNDIKNLWPQSYTTNPWNAHKKDMLENRLHKLVCKGKISLERAQKEISNNWVETYEKYFFEDCLTNHGNCDKMASVR